MSRVLRFAAEEGIDVHVIARRTERELEQERERGKERGRDRQRADDRG